MASFFGHAIVGVCGAMGLKRRQEKFLTLFALAVLCALIPDIDMVGYYLGVPYDSFWGHRGFTHSLLFAVLFSATLSYLYLRNKALSASRNIQISFLFFFCTISHSVLDALTTGGHGVAFFSPMIDDRIFFAIRPILVSPFAITEFLSPYGVRVLVSEMIFIGIPMLMIGSLFRIWSKNKR